MPKMSAGKVVEVTAVQAAHLPAGTAAAVPAIQRWLNLWGVSGYRPTNEEKKAGLDPAKDRRKSQLFMAGNRLNNGRGEIGFDAILRVGFLGHTDRVAEVPVSLKAGDSRDISTDIPLLQAIVKADMPFWVYILAGDARTVEYMDGVRLDVAPARNVTMRRINVTPLLRDLLKTWEIVDGEGEVTYVRKHTTSVKGVKYYYPRLRVTWGRIPQEYWLDREPVPFSPTAPLPYPW